MAASVHAVRPPIPPMLARLVRELPEDGYWYEPKWDGFRALAFRDGDRIELQSRHERPMARYFPELVEALRQLPSTRFVLDGEIVLVRDGRFDFGTLMLRTHPSASRVAQLSVEAPALFVAFDLLAEGGDDLRAVPFAERRSRLQGIVDATADRVRLTPATLDRAEATRWLERFTGNGVDGVVAKHRSLVYQPGKRAMLKVKVERTADCVVGGFRSFPGGRVASLLLGLHDETGMLRHIGVCSSFSEAARRQHFSDLSRRVTDLAGHPWEGGFGLERSPIGRLKGSAGRWNPAEMTMDWVPIRPLVAEVAYDTLDARRFRHPARFRRWRPDREPASCTFEQLPAETTNIEGLVR